MRDASYSTTRRTFSRGGVLCPRHATAASSFTVRGVLSAVNHNPIQPMKHNRFFTFLLFCILCAAFLHPLCIMAAEAAPSGVAADAPRFSALMALIPLIVPTALALLKLVVPHLPKVSLPILAILLGAGAEFAMSHTFGANTILGMILGSAGVGLRELVDQVKKATSVTQ